MIGKNVAIVAGVFLAGLLLLVALGAFLVAKSGIVPVPLFSGAYHRPQPVRTVTSSPISEAIFRQRLSDRVLAQVASGKRPPYTISITEDELNGAFQNVVAQALRSEGWRVESSQVALAPEFFEVYGRLTQGDLHADLRIRFVPIVENGGVIFEPIDIRFGEYPIHPDLAHRLAGALFKRDFGTWVLSFGEIRLQSVQLREGALDLTITMPTP
jgi:hypothetical protein